MSTNKPFVLPFNSVAADEQTTEYDRRGMTPGTTGNIFERFQIAT